MHPRLTADTFFVADWTLSRVVVMNDVRYPWVILIPRREGVVELFDLNAQDRGTMIEEIARASESLKRLTGASKMNVGALGNVVAQLHVHIVARIPGDAAWPGPVWGHGDAQPYDERARDEFAARLASAL